MGVGKLFAMSKSKAVQTYRDLDVYKASFRFQQEIFRMSKSFPKEEAYSLTDQVRRSARSIGANLAEAWAKRRYPAHFLSKLTDADSELQETVHWLRTALSCGYLKENEATARAVHAEKIGQMLGAMIANYRSFCPEH